MSWKDRLTETVRAGLNDVQERVTTFEQDGGIEGLAERVAERARRQGERLDAGKHTLNPDYLKQLRVWYARLELEPGATRDEVRHAFRELMRRYHPDRFANDARGEELATQLSQELTVAYEGLSEYLGS